MKKQVEAWSGSTKLILILPVSKMLNREPSKPAGPSKDSSKGLQNHHTSVISNSSEVKPEQPLAYNNLWQRTIRIYIFKLSFSL